MDILRYKGFIGSVEFSAEDEVFYGKIEGIKGLVNYEGESVKELKDAFHEAVESYLDFCEAHGISPHKSYSGNLNVRISPDTHSKIAELATKAGISINAYIRMTLDKAVSVAL